MKPCLIFIAVSLVSMLFTGCITSVVIVEETVIKPSGAALRSVSVSVITDGKNVEEAKEMLENSVLPEKPRWERKIKREGNGYILSANATFDRIGSTSFDEYLHKPITFKLIREFPFIKYEYSEDFAPLSDLKVSAVAEIVETTIMDELDRIVEPIPPDKSELLREDVRRILKSAFRGEKENKLKLELRNAIESAVNRRIDDSEFDAISRKIEKALSEKGKTKLKEAGLIGIVEFYPEYRITLRMPGRIIETNGEIVGDTIKWHVDKERYDQGGFKAYAYSRRLNLPALILTVIVVIVAVIVGVMLKIKRTSP